MLYSNNRNLPLTMAVWVANHHYDKDPTYIGGSQLAMSNRQIVLGLRTEETADLASMVAARLGHAINDSIDAAWKLPDLAARMKDAGFNSLFEYEINPTVLTPGKIPVYIQQRYSEPVGSHILSGAPDIIIGGRLIDYKSTTVFGFQKKEVSDYLWQLTAYRYLARDLITDDTATIQFILKDWSELRASGDPDYPQTPCPTMLVRVGSPAECLARLRTRIDQLNTLMALDQEELPACTDEELWLDPPKYAYYKSLSAPQGSRATRVFDTMAEALMYKGGKGNEGRIDTRKGTPKACLYCKANSICTQYANWPK
jgi:hypothetical protein